MQAAKCLKLVCVFATGYDNIDIAAARELGIAVCNVPGYSTDSVALFTVATVLSLYAHLPEYSEYVRSGEYTESGVPNRLVPVYHELKGKTWGIVGYGNIGRAVGRVAEAMGASVIACKRTPTDEVRCVDIDTLCRESDIITIHCPLNDGTRGIINKDRIALMKREVVIVNEARGAVVCEEDIAAAIESNRIAAFGCDVYSREPFLKDHPYSRILERKNVLLTPHAAWGAYESRARCISIIADNIHSFFNGKFLNRVDK
jgi:glycerate dehydrogenase